MSSTTQTQTFTVADIRKVVDSFAADYAMMAESTGLRTFASVLETVYDLKVFAEYRYLVKITLILKDEDGDQIRGAKYVVSEAAAGWSNDRPGNSLWPRTPGGTLKVVATLSSAWWNKTEAQKESFIEATSLNSPWGLTDEDTSLSKLTQSSGQQYSSRGYGLERTNYSL